MSQVVGNNSCQSCKKPCEQRLCGNCFNAQTCLDCGNSCHNKRCGRCYQKWYNDRPLCSTCDEVVMEETGSQCKACKRQYYQSLKPCDTAECKNKASKRFCRDCYQKHQSQAPKNVRTQDKGDCNEPCIGFNCSALVKRRNSYCDDCYDFVKGYLVSERKILPRN